MFSSTPASSRPLPSSPPRQEMISEETLIAHSSPPDLINATALRGSLQYDREHSYNLKWESITEFMTWKAKQEEEETVEWIFHTSQKPTTSQWTSQTIYRCGRGMTGGNKTYEKKTDQKRKLDTKKCDCKATLTIKTYPDTSSILGRFSVTAHNHPLGNGNIIYTRLPNHLRQEIRRLLMTGMKPDSVLKEIQGGQEIFTEDNLDNLRSNQDTNRRRFARREDVAAIQRELEAETLRLASWDGMSLIKWVDKLRSRGCYIFFKAANDTPPSDTGIDQDALLLIIQTRYQKECWTKYGQAGFVGLDATHNITHYDGVKLVTLISRDDWGHGMPCAWMISSNTKEVTIDFFLRSILDQNDGIVPRIVMSDKDRGQMNAIERRFPASTLLLCWWHVLHAWREHVCIPQEPELWELLKKWIHITNSDDFDAMWARIKIASRSTVTYLEDYWMKEQHLWSAVYRVDRDVRTKCETNMIVESWHHLLKSKFLEGKRNRRLDHLIYTLVDVAIPYFIERHHWQWFGFDGLNLELKQRSQTEATAATIADSAVSEIKDSRGTICYVQSQSDSSIFYTVNLESSECNCFLFPLIRYCKHLCAARRVHPESFLSMDITSLSTLPHDEMHSPNEQDSLNTPDEASPESSSGDDSDPTIDTLVTQISSLLNTLRSCPNIPIDGSLHTFSAAVKDFTHLVQHSGIGTLPRHQKIAPNQHSWTETAKVMGVAVKSKRKRAHDEDPYSAGEASGKKARSDPVIPSSAYPAPQLPIQPSLLAPGDCEYTPVDLANLDFRSNPRILNGLKVKQLSALCKMNGLHYSGTKDILIGRLESAISSQSTTSHVVPADSSVHKVQLPPIASSSGVSPSSASTTHYPINTYLLPPYPPPQSHHSSIMYYSSMQMQYPLHSAPCSYPVYPQYQMQ